MTKPSWQEYDAMEKTIVIQEAEIARLRKALEACHTWHNVPHICVDMVDKYYHEFFSSAYNPHAKPTTSPKG